MPQINQLRTACGQRGVREVCGRNGSATARNCVIKAVIIVEVVSEEIAEVGVLINVNPTLIVPQPSGVSGTREVVAIVRLGDQTKS